MKPLNLDNRPCSPISSNCVIWQGPNLDCIKLCTGDKVSDVIAALATELCTILDELKVSNYDLSAFGISSSSLNFEELVQFLIDKVAELDDINSGNGGSGSGSGSNCPDCIITVAACLKEIDPSLPTTMQLLDYVQMIASKICNIIDSVDVINSQIADLNVRVTALEDTPTPGFTLPSIPTGCLSGAVGGSSKPIDQVLNALVNDSTIGYCTLISKTGLPNDITSAISTQCIASTDQSLKSFVEGDSPVNTMATEYSGTWVNSPTTIAQAIKNLWTSICDTRAGIKYTVVAQGSGITVTPVTTGRTTTYTISSSGSGSLFEYEIGQHVSSRGGVIAHRWLSAAPLGTPTSGTIQNYLVVDTIDLSDNAPWSPNSDVPNCESTWNGQANTTAMMSASAAPFSAAALCDGSGNNGFNDWYLPAIDELSKIWHNRWEIAQGLIAAGGTQLSIVAAYWSSTEYVQLNGLGMNFDSGIAFAIAKNNTEYVRAVRRFSIP